MSTLTQASAGGGQPSRVTKNILASYLGRGWVAGIHLVFVPIYLKLLGVEAYGLVGFYVTLQATLLVFDLGLATTLNRELARRSALHADEGTIQDAVRTFELIYWAAAVAIACAVGLLSGLIADHWVRTTAISSGALRRAIVMMGVAAALQWPAVLYNGGLWGLQRHVLSNAVASFAVTVRFVGTSLALWLVGPSLDVFFACQIVAGLVQVWSFRRALWSAVPASATRPAFQAGILRQVWRFTLGINAGAIAVTAFLQVDKLLLSGRLQLAEFACYSIAWSLTTALQIGYQPIGSALFPVFSQRVARGDEAGLKELYHLGSQWIGALSLPAALVVALFAPEILRLWIRDSAVEAAAAPLARVLIWSAALGALTYVPFNLQWAFGWSRLTAWAHGLGTVVLVPALLVSVQHYGPLGAAAACLVVRAVMSALAMFAMHRRILRGELAGWAWSSTLLPLLVAAGVGVPWRVFARPVGFWESVLVVVGAWLTATVAAVAVTPAPALALAKVRAHLRRERAGMEA